MQSATQTLRYRSKKLMAGLSAVLREAATSEVFIC